MGNFEDFVRYGFPGYIFLVASIISFFLGTPLPTDPQLMRNYGALIGAILLVIGPLIGFLIHQIYFLYFDWKESYNKLSRPCIRIIFASYLQSKFYQPEQNILVVKKNCFVAWKFLSTNFDGIFKVEELFLSRLRGSRNYSHAFGSILTSVMLSTLVIAITAIFTWSFPIILLLSIDILWVVFFIFSYKRTELNTRIEEIETGIVLLHLDTFIAYTNKLIKLELENEIRMQWLKDENQKKAKGKKGT